MSKKLLPLIIMVTSLTCSCSNINSANKIRLAANIDTFLFDKENDFLEPNVEKISANLKVNANFAIYFTEEGCSSCEAFSPIMNSYIKSQNIMVYKFDVNKDKSAFDEFKEKYSERFFAGSTQISLPLVCIVNESEVSYVDYDSYMKTEKAFSNYMKSKYEVGRDYYIDVDPFSYEFINKEFAYINFDFENEGCLNLYISKLRNKLKTTKRKVIISSYHQDDLVHLKLVGRNATGTYSRLEFGVTEETSDETISLVL